MSLKLDVARLKELMCDFYILTGLKIVIFDDECNEIQSYPDKHCMFCSMIQNNPVTRPFCLNSNLHSFEECRKSGKLVIYHCHAGLIEATAPLKEKGIIIGYIMFGQVSDIRDKQIIAIDILKQFESSDLDLFMLQSAIRKIKYKSIPEIKAAAKILEACTYYILQNELISLKHEQLVHKMNKFINENLQIEITISILCEKLHVNRTKLYEITRQYLGAGIAEYIMAKRMEKAKSLILETDERISKISESTGFSDYSYFSKVFKKTFGQSPSAYRVSKRLESD